MASAPPNRIIIDTDPGIDDVLAMLLALSASPKEIELLMLSITYGNVEVGSCLRNAVTMFHVIEKELKWRRARGQLEGFDALRSKPIVAVGADHSLEEEILMADHFHGKDGLADVHETHPHLSPSDSWRNLFQPPKTNATPEEETATSLLAKSSDLFSPSLNASHGEILRLLRENPIDTITLIAIGPMTNFALAAAEDPEVFLRAKEVIVMGGAIDVVGNITPVAEFNTYADAVATARVFALTSLNPSTTMPPISEEFSTLPPYPTKLSRPLNLTLLPLDITTQHLLRPSVIDSKLLPLIEAGSPLAEWTYAFVSRTVKKVALRALYEEDIGLELHDPLCVWYAMTRSSPLWKMNPEAPEDIRVETTGQWTRGMHLLDRTLRGESAWPDKIQKNVTISMGDLEPVVDKAKHRSGENGGWRNVNVGNRINRIVTSPDEELFGSYLLDRIFG